MAQQSYRNPTVGPQLRSRSQFHTQQGPRGAAGTLADALGVVLEAAPAIMAHEGDDSFQKGIDARLAGVQRENLSEAESGLFAPLFRKRMQDGFDYQDAQYDAPQIILDEYAALQELRNSQSPEDFAAFIAGRDQALQEAAEGRSPFYRRALWEHLEVARRKHAETFAGWLTENRKSKSAEAFGEQFYAALTLGGTTSSSPKGNIAGSGAKIDFELEGKIRDKPLSEQYLNKISSIVGSLGDNVGVVITSAGQDDSERTGSHRHDVDEDGVAHTADFVLTVDGKKVTPKDSPELYEALIERAAAEGFTGIGHYDWGVHVGGGSPAFWGPDTTGDSADPRFAQAYQRGLTGGPALTNSSINNMFKALVDEAPERFGISNTEAREYALRNLVTYADQHNNPDILRLLDPRQLTTEQREFLEQEHHRLFNKRQNLVQIGRTNADYLEAKRDKMIRQDFDRKAVELLALSLSPNATDDPTEMVQSLLEHPHIIEQGDYESLNKLLGVLSTAQSASGSSETPFHEQAEMSRVEWEMTRAVMMGQDPYGAAMDAVESGLINSPNNLQKLALMAENTEALRDAFIAEEAQDYERAIEVEIGKAIRSEDMPYSSTQLMLMDEAERADILARHSDLPVTIVGDVKTKFRRIAGQILAEWIRENNGQKPGTLTRRQLLAQARDLAIEQAQADIEWRRRSLQAKSRATTLTKESSVDYLEQAVKSGGG